MSVRREVTHAEHWHGTLNGYTNHGCRCQDCRAAAARDGRDARQRRRLQLELDPTLAPHGTDSTYCNWMCRCDPCKNAHKEASQEARAYERRVRGQK